jgi:hypothetical protein
MLASYHGHAPLVKLLLQHGADPNSLNDRGQSPLAGAVFKGEVDVIEVYSPLLFSSCDFPFPLLVQFSLTLPYCVPGSRISTPENRETYVRSMFEGLKSLQSRHRLYWKVTPTLNMVLQVLWKRSFYSSRKIGGRRRSKTHQVEGKLYESLHYSHFGKFRVSKEGM